MTLTLLSTPDGCGSGHSFGRFWHSAGPGQESRHCDDCGHVDYRVPGTEAHQLGTVSQEMPTELILMQALRSFLAASKREGQQGRPIIGSRELMTMMASAFAAAGAPGGHTLLSAAGLLTPAASAAAYLLRGIGAGPKGFSLKGLQELIFEGFREAGATQLGWDVLRT